MNRVQKKQNIMDEKNNSLVLTQEETDALMAKVLSGNYTPQEYDLVSSWLAADNANLTEFRQVRS